MTDIPEDIQELQLKLWLSKPPGERLFQFLKDNDDMLSAIADAKEKLKIPFPKFIETKSSPRKDIDQKLPGE